MLKLCGGRQHIVGIVSGVCLKMFHDHGEQIFTRKALNHFARLRRNGHGIAVVDHQGFHLRSPLGTTSVIQVIA